MRLHDNAAWTAAAKTGKPVVPVYIHSEDEENVPQQDSPCGWWLHHALEDLASNLAKDGISLALLKGNPVDCFKNLLKEFNVTGVYWNRCFEPSQVDKEKAVSDLLSRLGIPANESNSSLMVEPEKILNNQGKPFKVYTAFARAWSSRPMAAPSKGIRPSSGGKVPGGMNLETLGLLSGRDGGTSRLSEYYKPTRAGALSALESFLSGPISSYNRDRDIPAIDGTSRLSPYLHWGQIGPREIYAKVARQPVSTGSKKFISELAWREFAYYILHHFPHTVESPFRPEFEKFPWSGAGPQLEAWKAGKTGFPLVDAGMRQLSETGYVHNRVRMLVASFLVKHLMISWRTGAEYFMRRLIDADLANNTLGWQWVAGCGVDAAPYFRIFNPVLQGKKFDKKAEYIRRHVPELQHVPDSYVHEPWTMPDAVQKQAKCVIGTDYPEPVCGLMEGRIRALSAWKSFNEPQQQNWSLNL